ncbi:TetR/AcrR family transcriptional regulator [uncultured Pseudoflavonifractor sp.]|uniref:TetR/AcrR family transcriptional regulator n=1 Tax=uncultured Pseudoflavonifractor sp. TaxID=1221379 RepID=UPI0025EEC77E|nr:TetR/AcrR family transcriptional regulator [uncultured Pseudoflavonifractor sp.]
MANARSGREDRRVTFTKNAIKDALLELMGEKGFEKLSISAVCGAAQITRTTFYSHYDSLDQVLDELIDEAFEVAEYSSTTLSMTMPQRLNYLAQFDTVEKLREHNSDLPTCQRIADTPKYRVLFQDRTISEYIKNKLFRMMKPSVVPDIMEYCHISQDQAERIFRYMLAGSYEVNSALNWTKNDAWFASRLTILRMETAGLEAIRAANAR